MLFVVSRPASIYAACVRATESLDFVAWKSVPYLHCLFAMKILYRSKWLYSRTKYKGATWIYIERVSLFALRVSSVRSRTRAIRYRTYILSGVSVE